MHLCKHKIGLLNIESNMGPAIVGRNFKKDLLAILYSMVELTLPTPSIEKAHTRMVYLTDVFNSFTIGNKQTKRKLIKDK